MFACGEGAALSHRSAAALWGFLKPVRGPIHVTSPSLNGRARQPGIVLHRSASLATSRPPQTSARDGIPVTTPQRTIDDLGGLVEPYEERRAIRQAQLAGHKLDAAVDFLWRAERVAVEADFYAYHRGSVAFEDDHRRDLDLRRAGFRVRRYTDQQLDNSPALVVADLREALGIERGQ